jgi:hypothetical protein
MPQRLSKRQQREVEELETLASVKPDPLDNKEENVVTASHLISSTRGFEAVILFIEC